ncbi:MAG: hypothetical protein A2X12_11915 [Bacteroidetes bacterium GWE2_29_8]|nr:MAG: hypothetical protein A2X12_11915 [Bacteroidetes bacterium GWE2_29_8]OFY22165.1 MAG: hypothetical protein A2X02_00380 [Bacteroidetes bacterium GWF2_29_10]
MKRLIINQDIFRNNNNTISDNFISKKQNRFSLKSFAVIAFVMLFTVNAFSQQIPLFSNYIFDKTTINPAFIGSNTFLNATLGMKKQFMGFDNAPQTEFLNLNMPIQAKRMGIGIRVIQDKLGVTKNNIGMLGYSYHIRIGEGKLFMGIEAGVYNQSIGFDELIKNDVVDNAIPVTKESKTVFNATFGMMYNTKKYYIGFSMPQLIKSKIDYTELERDKIAHLWNHLYFMGGYQYEISDKFKLEPSFLLKYVKGVPMQIDINAEFTYNNLLTIGAGYRTTAAIVGLFKISKTINSDGDLISIGYNYDYLTTELANYSSGAHEVMIQYAKKLAPPARKVKVDPRYYIK